MQEKARSVSYCWWTNGSLRILALAQLSLGYSGGHVCSALLTSEECAITAAHCVNRILVEALVHLWLVVIFYVGLLMMVNVNLFKISTGAVRPSHKHEIIEQNVGQQQELLFHSRVRNYNVLLQ